MSYGSFIICANCATYGYPPNNEAYLLKRISDNIIEFVCCYATCATLVVYELVYEYLW